MLPHLDRAVELLWESGHPAIAEALDTEAKALIASYERTTKIVYPSLREIAEIEPSGYESVASQHFGDAQRIAREALHTADSGGVPDSLVGRLGDDE